MRPSLATDGRVGAGTVFTGARRLRRACRGSMAVVEVEQNQLFGSAIDTGNGEFHPHLRFEPIAESATEVTALTEVSGMPEDGDSTRRRAIMRRWLEATESLV